MPARSKTKGSPEKKIKNIIDIARLAGVSTATVSRVLNNKAEVSDEVRQKVLTLISDANFSPRQMTSPSNIIGITLEYHNALSSPYLSNILRTAEEMAFEAGFNLLLLRNEQLRKNEEHVTVHLKQSLLSGVIVLLSQANDTFSKHLARDGFPHVIVSNRPEDAINYVDCDWRGGTVDAVRYLASLGHRRIALHLPSNVHYNDQERIAGYREGLEQSGLTYVENLVYFHESSYGQANPPIEDGLRMLLGQKPRPTALLTDCAWGKNSDLLTLLQMKIQVPEEISVMIFQDMPELQRLDKRVSAISQDAGELGQIAARMVINQIRGKSGLMPSHLILPTRLLIGDTTTPP